LEFGKMPRYHLHLRDCKDEYLTEDEDGEEFESLEHAYLAAFAGAQEMWANLLPKRVDPRDFAFEITDRHGAMLMTVPFSEVLDSCRKAGRSARNPGGSRAGPGGASIERERNKHQRLAETLGLLLLISQQEIASARATIERSRDLVRDCRLLRTRIAG